MDLKKYTNNYKVRLKLLVSHTMMLRMSLIDPCWTKLLRHRIYSTTTYLSHQDYKAPRQTISVFLHLADGYQEFFGLYSHGRFFVLTKYVLMLISPRSWVCSGTDGTTSVLYSDIGQNAVARSVVE